MWNLACFRSFVATGTVVTWMPLAVSRSSCVATSRPDKDHSVDRDAPRGPCLSRLARHPLVVGLAGHWLHLVLVDRCSGVSQVECPAE